MKKINLSNENKKQNKKNDIFGFKIPKQLELKIIHEFLPITDLLNVSTASKRMNELAKNQYYWKRRFEIHFPHLFKKITDDTNINYFKLFKKSFQEEYKNFTVLQKQLFSLVKDGDIESIKKLKLNKNDLLKVDVNNMSAVTWAIKNKNQNILDYFFGLFNISLDSALYFNQIKTVRDLCKEEPYKEKINIGQINLMAETGQLEILQILLNAKPNLINEVTLLTKAVANGHLDIVNYLIEKEVNLNQKINNPESKDHNKTALYLAVEKGQQKIATLLLKKNANPNITIGNKKLHLLHLAAQLGQLDVVKKILTKNLNLINVETTDKQTPFIVALVNGHKDIVSYLIEKEKTLKGKLEKNLEQKFNGKTVLYLAVENSQPKTAMFLLSKGAKYDIEAGNGHDKLHLLHLAAQLGQFEVVKAIVTKDNSLIEKKDYYDQTPLILAAVNGHKDIVKYLIETNEKGTNLEQKINKEFDKNDKKTALYLAVENGHQETAVLLIKNGANYDIVAPKSKLHLLHLALQHGQLNVVKAILKRNPKLSKIKNTDNETSLVWAIKNSHHKAAILILDKGAQLKITNDSQLLHLAVRSGALSIVETIVKKYPELIKMKNTNGLTPLMLAAAMGHNDIVEYLIRQPEISLNENLPNILYLTSKYNREKTTLIIVKYILEKRPSLILNLITGKNTEGQSFLFWAINKDHNGNISKALKLFITEGAHLKFDNVSDMQFTLIHWAVLSGNLSTVKSVLSKNPGAINAQDVCGQTPLIWAAAKGFSDIVEHLISQPKIQLDAKTNAPNNENNGKTASDWAIEKKHTAIAEMLVKKEKMLLEKAKMLFEKEKTVQLKEQQQLPRDIKQDSLNLDNVKTIIKNDDSNANTVSNNNEPNQINSLNSNNKSVSDSTQNTVDNNEINQGKISSDVILNNQQSNDKKQDKAVDDNSISLDSAIKDANQEAVEEIIKNNKDIINPTNPETQTPLYSAAVLGRLNIVKCLINNGATLRNYGENILYGAIKNNKEEIAKWLIENKAGELLAPNMEFNPLHLAVKNNQPEIVKAIIAKQPDLINGIDNDGKTPLLLAVEKENTTVINALLKNNNIKINNDDKSLLTAVRSNNLKIVKTIIENKPELIEATPYASISKNYGKTTALDWAIEKDHEEIAMAIIEKATKINDGNNHKKVITALTDKIKKIIEGKDKKSAHLARNKTIKKIKLLLNLDKYIANRQAHKKDYKASFTMFGHQFFNKNYRLCSGKKFNFNKQQKIDAATAFKNCILFGNKYNLNADNKAALNNGNLGKLYRSHLSKFKA